MDSELDSIKTYDEEEKWAFFWLVSMDLLVLQRKNN